MIFVVHRTGMMVVVRVGARLIWQMREDSPSGIVRGAGLAQPCVFPWSLVKLVEYWRHDPGEIQHQEQRGSLSSPTRPAGSKLSTNHATKPTSEPVPSPDP